MTMLYNTLSSWLNDRFGCKVFKVSVSAGLTCPNRDGTKGTGGCIYCDCDSLLPYDYSGEDIRSQIDAGIRHVEKRHGAEKFIAYFQLNTNTYASLDYLIDIYTEAMRHPEIVCLAVSTRPDCVDDEVLKLLAGLKEKKHVWLELGLQSANDATLSGINRGHGSWEFEDACERARSFGLDVCAHVIMGLPGEGREDMLETINFAVRCGIWGIKFHQLQVIKGTPLEESYNRGEILLLTLEEYASIVVECLEIMPKEIVIHRLSGDAPLKHLIGPNWGANKFMIMDAITRLLHERKSFQGSRCKKPE